MNQGKILLQHPELSKLCATVRTECSLKQLQFCFWSSFHVYSPDELRLLVAVIIFDEKQVQQIKSSDDGMIPRVVRIRFYGPNVLFLDVDGEELIEIMDHIWG